MNQIPETHKCLRSLIDELRELLDKNWESSGAYIPPGSIRRNRLKLHMNVRNPEQSFEAKKLFKPTWELWGILKQISEESDHITLDRLQLDECSDLLLWWADQLLEQKTICCEKPIPSSYLDLLPDWSERRILRRRYEGMADFCNSYYQWMLFRLLFKAEERGLTRKDLFDDLYSDNPNPPLDNTLDQHKRNVNQQLKIIGIKISANGSGNWSLRQI